MLELVLEEESVSMVLRRMSPVTGSSEDLGVVSVVVVVLIQGWSQICSRMGRSEGRRARHHLISCWHSAGEREREREQRQQHQVRRRSHTAHGVCDSNLYGSLGATVGSQPIKTQHTFSLLSYCAGGNYTNCTRGNNKLPKPFFSSSWMINLSGSRCSP